MTDHPITPPPELVQQWLQKATGPDYEQRIATQAARWGADRQLNADCSWLENTCYNNWDEVAEELRAAMRPKPPTLKEQALDGLQRIETNIPQSLKEFEASCDVIRRALEQLDD